MKDAESPQEHMRCACLSWTTPVECVRHRYGRNPTSDWPDDSLEECECPCHYEEDEDDWQEGDKDER